MFGIFILFVVAEDNDRRRRCVSLNQTSKHIHVSITLRLTSFSPAQNESWTRTNRSEVFNIIAQWFRRPNLFTSST